MKAQLLLWFTVLIVLASCTGNKQSDDGIKLLDYKYFTIRVPQRWKEVNTRGIDSFVGEIHIDTGTIVSFDLGWYSNDLAEGSEDYIIRHDSLIVLKKSPIPNATKPIEYYKGKPDSSIIHFSSPMCFAASLALIASFANALQVNKVTKARVIRRFIL